ncbi:MAG: thioredoxin domain-containing protein [Gemmatimonadetes bacterium]|nr:thioredoxin domain-containing protein [Gemmatimonadota bacterium]
MSSRLASAQSAYLRSAAHQPVQWHPWGAEAFERAKAEGKPILLDIGAVWCHWCHVMDGESYENPVIAEILNRDWICIKVDRDERPDVDARYQRAVQALTQQGGWPLTAFLTSDGAVFYGGTYFPPDDRHGRPGFGDILTELARIYREQPDRVVTQAGEIQSHLTQILAESRSGSIDAAILDQAGDAMARLFDFRHGGFGDAPKFPHPTACEFLLARWFDTGERWPREIVDRTLTAMARGGMYDQIGGGFHRYSVDARWIVPHFEILIYDNWELLWVFVHAAGTAGRDGIASAEYGRVISGITSWVRDVMSDPAGGYYASQDADVGLHDDGDYFTWTVDEARAVTTEDEFAVLACHYDIEDAGEMHHNPRKNVLFIRQSIAEVGLALGKPEAEVESLLESGRSKLREARSRRTAPFLDRTLYTGWNAMMASALLEAGQLEPHALLTLERIFREASVDNGSGGVRHAIGSEVGGMLEDQVHLANAAIDAYEATGRPEWLERARRLGEHIWNEYANDDGSLSDVARNRGGEGLLQHRIKPVQDSPTPSPNGVAGIVAARLGAHTSGPEWRKRLETLLTAFAGGAVQLSIHGATLFRAIDWYLNPSTHIVIVGTLDNPTVAAMHRGARTRYRPRKVVTLLAPEAPRTGLPSHLQAMVNGQSPRGYVCRGTRCNPPASNTKQLVEILATSGPA